MREVEELIDCTQTSRERERGKVITTATTAKQ